MSRAPAVDLSGLRACFEGAVPGVIATCAADGTPNVAYISQVYYVDERHIALSFQFFNRTRANILDNPRATVLVMDPVTARFHRLHLRYRRTETAGALFESMKAQLAGIASHTGMADVFRLLGADVHEVERVETLEGDALAEPPARTDLPAHLRRASERFARCATLDALLGAALAAIAEITGTRHAMVLMLDAVRGQLYTVASSGYATSGVGSEIALGEGVIGVAAREATAVRIGHVTNAYLYSDAARRSLAAQPGARPAATDIPYPGLAAPHSQLAVPIVSAARVLGVLFVESPSELAFGYADEDALVTLAGHLGAAIEWMRADGDAAESRPADTPAAPAAGAPLVVRHYDANDSIFIGDDYLIKGVAGAIFWKLLHEHARGRHEFTNRELRLDSTLGLPDVTDNLEARLLLLQRRLIENSPHVRIEKTGRGRFRLLVQRPVRLQSVSG